MRPSGRPASPRRNRRVIWTARWRFNRLSSEHVSASAYAPSPIARASRRHKQVMGSTANSMCKSEEPGGFVLALRMERIASDWEHAARRATRPGRVRPGTRPWLRPIAP
eukprot:CAMPEP_0195059044 /NCGR_PEP_ID=MMETSP0448-20130528/6633_1 /TAXON_ID=66468 /ORGANISM="Heterocapsa triquestra, Strain CCMP 448" /LENGTH=108 /DNA_ID=CAMNT_0040089247 /DNA_START=39 /DNA_END=363 /DNA_ORIENTATION=+